MRLIKYADNTFPIDSKFIRFSVGTPCIEIQKGIYLGVGHIKIKYNYLKAEMNDIKTELEKHYIKLYNCVRPDGMNLTFGGDGTLGCKQSLKNKKKASIRMMGENNPNRKNSPWNKGQTLSKEITNNMSLAQKNRPPESFKRGEEHHWFGKKHTEETKELMRKSALERENKKRMEAKNG